VVYSGDLVKKDREGFLYYIGRKDSMIKKDGYRISPTEVEEVLMGHPDVFEAVVYGEVGQAADIEMVALVTAKRELDIRELRIFCRHKVPEYLIPDRFLVLDQFARTETGKIDRTGAIKEARADYAS
jgi:acyl-coenzyme A synthetase/AMP-(fatty) acid ligase